jgi:beta-lactam-binding protein with PASTA domain
VVDEETYSDPDQPSSEADTSGVEQAAPEEAGLDFASMETPEELAPAAPTSPDDQRAAEELVPALDRPRLARRPIVSQGVWLSLALLVLAVGIGIAALMLANTASLVSVPSVIGRPEGVARTILAQTGLQTGIAERRFSDRPEGQVLSQSPQPGADIEENGIVEIVVSAGTEELLMPDVVGDGIALAKGTLEAAGLVVQIESVPSQAASDTVLSTTPSPGVPVRSGDVVRVQIAAPLADGGAVQPYDLDGLVFVLDPAPVKGEQTDITLTTARRLQALLEASGAKVRMLRSSNSTATSEAARRKRAARSKGVTAGVGLTVRNAGLSGRTVGGSNKGAKPALSQDALVGGMANQLAIRVPPASQVPAASDPVFSKRYPWLRIGLGSFDNAADKAAFEDSRWADQAAEAIYTGLGEVFGTKESL